ncbi:MAG TPA: twin-arginine translocase subunit TatC [Acetobacteraceae bacterium]
MAKTEEEDVIDDKPRPLLDHLIELRRRLMWSVAAFAIAFVFCYHFSTQVYGFLAQPLVDILSRQSGEPRRMIFTQLTEAFFTYLKVAFFGAAFIAFPVIATQLWLFIAPGLYRSEKRAFAPFLLASPVLFVAGAALAYYVVFPAAWSFFISFETPAGSGGVPIQLEAKVGEYLDLVMKLIFAFGIAFQMPVALSLMAKVGIITSASLKKYRRYAIVGMFVVAAVLTPPDPISQLGLAMPLIALYELSVLAARLVEPKPQED